jgi:fructose-bisphosphate aldolase class I
MDHQLLETTARQLVREGHGLLAADDSSASTAKRFEAVGIENSEEARRTYRQMLMTASKAPEVLSGVILFEETFNQKVDDGKTFPEYLNSVGILPGIKLDQGLQDLQGFPGEKITAGLDALPKRAEEFSKQGARFAKWRNVIAIGDGIPTDECIGANTYILSRYARICQEYNIVPIVEPEVLMDGNHTAEECEQVTARVYDIMFQTLRAFRVHLPGCVMKTAMVLPGKQSDHEMNPDEVAERTVRVLKHHTPAELGGVVFLSGGQSTGQALINLNRIEQQAQKEQLSYGVTFSYLRSLQDPALNHWAKNQSDSTGAQEVLNDLLEKASAARNGRLDENSLHPDHVTTSKASGFWEY